MVEEHPKSRVAIDLVSIRRIEESLERFGQRFLQRLFRADEIAYATEAPALTAQRLAARFAAKEAALKALRLATHGVGLRNIEVRRDYDSDCPIRLHGSAQKAALEAGMTVTSISLTHEGDYAAAVVLVQCVPPASSRH